MASKEFNSLVTADDSIRPLLRTASVNGTSVDMQGYQSARAVFYNGAITDGTFTPKLQESDDNSSFSDVAAADYLGGAAPTAQAQNTVVRATYIGSKRYVRPVITVTGSPSTGGTVAAIMERSHASQNPVA